MNIEMKIIGISFILWLTTYYCAFPDTKFADWGEKVFGTYDKFLDIIMLLLLPVPICALILIIKA